MTQFPHLTRGNVGPVTAANMNAVFEASSRVLGDAARVPGVRGIPPKGIWVQLLAETTYGGVSAWSWRAVSKATSAIDDDNADLLRSSMWPDGDGLAVELGTTNATPNGYALIYPLAAYDGKSWFAFSTAGAGGTLQRRLPIIGATGSTPPFEYTVSVDGDSAEAINQYEQSPYGYGQGLTFASGDLVPAPCEGTVICSYLDGAWYFSEPNPMTPECAV